MQVRSLRHSNCSGAHLSSGPLVAVWYWDGHYRRMYEQTLLILTVATLQSGRSRRSWVDDLKSEKLQELGIHVENIFLSFWGVPLSSSTSPMEGNDHRSLVQDAIQNQNVCLLIKCLECVTFYWFNKSVCANEFGLWQSEASSLSRSIWITFSIHDRITLNARLNRAIDGDSRQSSSSELSSQSLSPSQRQSLRAQRPFLHLNSFGSHGDGVPVNTSGYVPTLLSGVLVRTRLYDLPHWTSSLPSKQSLSPSQM